MELVQKTDVRLADQHRYTGWGYYANENFIPHGAGKKFYEGYYAFGNFINGVIDGPAIISHDYYMNTVQFKNNRGNGWGLCINRGTLAEFGYYENSQLKVDLTDYALWYYTKMQQAQRNENMLNLYTYKDTHQVSELLVGYKGNEFNVFMGFRFMLDGSVWLGNTNTHRLDGNLIHFCSNGTIECGEFSKGNLVEPMDIQDLIDYYYGTCNIDDDLFMGLNISSRNNTLREKYRNIEPIKVNFNYFAYNQGQIDNSKGEYSMQYKVMEVDLTANGDFKKITEETWNINEHSIVTTYGTLLIEDAIFVEDGPLVGVQLSVSGIMHLDKLNSSQRKQEIATFALMRRPNNVWVWVYAFDKYGNPVVNFCGYDNLDNGLAELVSRLKRIYK